MNYYQKRVSDIYSPLVKAFLEDIREVNLKLLPEPHLPVVCDNYGKFGPKILFMGWETRGHCKLEQWVKSVTNVDSKSLYYYQDEINDFEFLEWRSNFGKDFWSFALRILAGFNNLDTWQELYRQPEKYSNILSSFAWANADSIERFSVTAQKNGCVLQNWEAIKEASRKFDSPKLIFDALGPDVVIFTHWGSDEKWFLDGIEITYEAAPHQFLWQYLTNKPKSCIFWTPHPRGFQQRGIDHDDFAYHIVSLYNETT